MVELLTVPYLGTAEDDVLLSAWLVPEGGAFRKGESLAVVETLKASFEVEAEGDGVLLQHLVEAGLRLPLCQPLGVTCGADESPTDDEVAELVRSAASSAKAPAAEASRSAAQQAHSDPESADVAAAPAARRRARELGIALAGIAGTGPDGMIRVADVEGAATAVGDGRLDPDLLAYLRRDGDTFAQLASDLKVLIYRRCGARIGDGVVLGTGVVLRAERLVLGAGCRFGANTTVDAEEFTAGALVQFGPRCTVRCRRVQLGANAFFAADIEIGGGGAMDPDAELVVGSHGFVGEHVHLNPCRRLELGDEVVISRGAVLMTHSFGGSVLQGMPNRFAPVSIGDRSQVGIGAVLFPGVEMGEGSILLSGSSLVTSVPAGRLFGGVPAEDMKAAARVLTPAEQEQVARELLVEFGRHLSLRGLPVESDGGATLTMTVTADGVAHRLRFCSTLETVADAEVCIAMRAAADVWDAVPPEVVAIDLSVPRIRGHGGPLADALREFLRKRGVRLHPRTWTYPGGWL